MRRFEGYPNLLQRGIRSLREEGLRATFNKTVYVIRRETLTRLREERFDRRWGIDTAGVVYPLRENVDAPFLAAEGYEGTPPEVFDEIMQSLRERMPRPATFIDIGCGKGRTLAMATRYGFTRIVGVEILSSLAAVAARNVAKLAAGASESRAFEVVCLNAAEYVFPDEDAVIFFFNPFSEEIMIDVLRNIRRSANRRRWRCIAYYNPKLGHLFADGNAYRPVAVNGDKYHVYEMVL